MILKEYFDELGGHIWLSEVSAEHGGPIPFVKYVFESGRLEGVTEGAEFYQPQIEKLLQENSMLQTQVHNRNVALLIIAIAAALGLSVWGLRKLYKKYKAEKENTYRKTTACN